MQLQAKDCWQPPATETEVRTDSPWEPPERARSANTFTLDFWPPEL